ncbi:UDP-N-acetylglucosamine 2-epimerase (non-hydrolyzing) [Brachybacterium muris]|uniref:non-hydrolyzing UDP-N-acetylglucosamine 2-epimerase n=1 Tax=Brachybacterium muris TaxID=219301 RepID=UPI001955FB19|nr:UDP-N-acetylglucosamine 2-epimerase (non-hydrolyzing) [Brachybacterium muris]MBM7502082.1 UDP-N-acetylglucosamine 2-epimerase (non-hydrolyzing) [Brachybacterium muris]
MTIYGTRPEAIKVAPVIKAIEKADDLESIVVVTGQHREMLDQVNTMFGIIPDHDLNIMSAGQSLNGIVAKVISGVDRILELEQPDAVIVQGDTSTVMGAAVAAFNRQIPVIHLEAGLRSGNIDSPFPEEANRKLTSQITKLHLAPTETSKANLVHESISENDIVVTGNSVIDTLLYATKLEVEFSDERLQKLQEQRNTEGGVGRVLLVTAHRRENLGAAMADIGNAVADLARKYDDLTIVFPVHLNPKVREAALPPLEGLPNVIVTEPMAYAEFTKTLSLVDIVLTDSGGVQEEAPSLGKPVLVMRENTERPEAVLAGTVKLIGTRRERIVDEVSLLLDSEQAYAAMAYAVNPYGDGVAANRTVEAINWKFAGGLRPLDFGV